MNQKFLAFICSLGLAVLHYYFAGNSEDKQEKLAHRIVGNVWNAASLILAALM